MDLAPEAASKMLRQSIANVYSLGFGKALLISYRIEGISGIRPEMSPPHLDLVLFYSLPMITLACVRRAPRSGKTYAQILPILQKSFYDWILSSPTQELKWSCKG